MATAPLSVPADKRLLSRLGSDYLLRSARIVAEAIDRDLMTAMVLLAIVTENTRGIMRSPDGVAQFGGVGEIPPDEMRQPVSVYALSRLLKTPYETTRRHVHKLAEREQVTMTSAGIIAPRAAVQSDVMRTALLESWRNTMGLVRDAAWLGIWPKGPTPPEGDVRRQGIRITAAFFVDAVTLIAGATGLNAMEVLVLRGVAHANIQHLRTEAQSTQQARVLAQVPPDGERRAISALALSDFLMVPYETVRRTCLKLDRLGYIERQGKTGYLVPVSLINEPRIISLTLDFANLTERLLADLSAICGPEQDWPGRRVEHLGKLSKTRKPAG